MDEVGIKQHVGNGTKARKCGSVMLELIERIRKQMIVKNEKSALKYNVTDPAITDYIASVFISKGLA